MYVIIQNLIKQIIVNIPTHLPNWARLPPPPPLLFSARFLLGGDHGRQKFEPPEGFSPVSECLLPAQQMSIDPCFHFGELAKGVLAGPLVEQEDPVFVPQPIDTSAVRGEGRSLIGSRFER